MQRKILAIIIIILVVVGAYSLIHEYRAYKARELARIQRLQQQAQEVQVTTIEGWTAKDIAAELETKKLVTAADFLKAQNSFDASNYPLVNNNLPDKMSLEGFLFPDTYRFNATSTSTAIIDKMLTDFTERMAKINVTADQKTYRIPGYEQYPLTFYQVLTLASIIEKESGGKGPMSLDQERAMIAGVFYNRLAIGQALESDATVNYVTGKNSPGASATDRSVNSPYNTYKYPGLPPGPICNPSLSSIYAALHPQKTNNFYFFHKQPSGEAVFSKTFAEHQSKM